YRVRATIRNSEELRRGTIEQLEKARIRLQKVELEADEYRMNGYSEIEREKANLINATSISLEQLEKSGRGRARGARGSRSRAGRSPRRRRMAVASGGCVARTRRRGARAIAGEHGGADAEGPERRVR
uniref:Uncharacterized protein n=1 Tax=Aegilops tauschii subsp. strangulata TaxID=200361 RepID=A0A453H4F6_AEGTS